MNVTICYDFHRAYIIIEEVQPDGPPNFHVYEAPPVYPSLDPSPQGCSWQATTATFKDAYAHVEEFALANATVARAAEALEDAVRRQRRGGRPD